MRRAILAILATAVCGAQTTVNGGRDFIGTLKTTGSLSAVDFRSAGSTAPAKTGLLAARPSACSQGDVYFATDGTAGQNLSFCTATGNPGTWAAMTAGSGGGAGASAGVSYCAPASGSGSAYSCSPAPPVTSYSQGMTVALVPDVAGTGGATTLNVNLLGAKSIKLSDGGTNPASADLAVGRMYFATYDGTVFRLGRGVQAKGATSHQFLTAIGADGSVSAAQPVASDITGLSTSATTDATNASNISSGTLADARLSTNVALGSRANTYTAYNDFSGGSMRPPESTASALPPASGVPGSVYLVTDGASVGACTTGGGSNHVLCRSTGSAYECIGNCSTGGGGGGGEGTPGGQDGSIQYANSGSFAGQAYVLGGGARLQRGVECSSGTVSYTALNANSTVQEVSILTAVPAKFRYNHVLVQEATQFIGSPTLQVGMGTAGVGTDLLLPLTLKQSTAPQNYGYETPRPPAVGNGTYNLVLQFSGSAALGNGTTTLFSGGSVNWEVCGFTVQ